MWTFFPVYTADKRSVLTQKERPCNVFFKPDKDRVQCIFYKQVYEPYVFMYLTQLLSFVESGKLLNPLISVILSYFIYL